MGVNALLGIFLTFLGGYWAALYSGVSSFQTVRKGGPRGRRSSKPLHSSISNSSSSTSRNEKKKT